MWHPTPASREQADRLTLISEWGRFNLDRPVLVHAGETVWVEGNHLMVKRADGEVTAHPGFTCR
ncbi:hypothetical protein CS0771_31370 [Catellatospora sp. IY07-71]|uniref:hypothetical protein n=1 Tax=Catellatospora sp. IY07-71 TaxID=2728827 RepID=UPI001BB3623C|nr:hypothetical protein [Catellatospora sp. IY07-71]BCJ73593.1 hypothetical protein CS0771_31370 [Catellatospora sp. IY07-71]